MHAEPASAARLPSGTWHPRGVSESPEFPPELRARFEPGRELGRGAFGVVLEARDRELGRRVAVKLLRGALPADARSRFAAEATLLAELRHPGVVEVYDHGESDAGPYLVMELLEGRTFEEAPPPDPVEAVLQVAGALEELHRAGVVHRDLKPSNLMTTSDGRVVLMDFGLARQLSRETITRTGAMVGTPGYLAPELWRGELSGPGGDWYALGVTLFELLEGRVPYVMQTLLFHGRGQPLPPPCFEATAEGSPARRVAIALLDSAPHRRPASATALRRTAYPRDAAPAPPVAPAAPHAAPLRRGPLVAAALAGSALLVFAGSLLLPDAAPAPARAASPAISPAEARERELREPLERALETMAAVHRRPDGGYDIGRLGATPGGHLTASLRELADVRHSVRYRRFLDALVTWLEGAPAAVADAYLQEAVLPLLDHLAEDSVVMAWYDFQPHAYGSEDPEVRRRRILDLETYRSRRRELGEIREQTLNRLEPLLSRPMVTLVGARLGGMVPPERKLALVRRLIAHALDARTPAATATLAQGLLLLGPPANTDGRPFTCQDRFRIAEVLTYASRGEGLAPRVRGGLTAQALYRRVQHLNSCRQGVDPAELAELSRLVDALEGAEEASPGGVLLSSEAILIFHRAAGFLLADYGPDFEALMDRVEVVAARVDTRLRGHPRGWAPGRTPPDTGIGGVLASGH